MKKTLASIAILAALLCTGGESVAANNTPPEHPNAGKFEPWQCVFERDHVPPLDSEAERLFLRAREIQRRPYPSKAEKEEVFTLYKQAAERGHWRAMTHLTSVYMEGFGTVPSITSADDMVNAMMKRGIPIGFYLKHLLVEWGRGVSHDPAEAKRLLHKAADLGSPQAQYKLGEYYLYTENRQRQGMACHVCALRQGYADSAHAIAGYLLIVNENYLMAAEYYLREAALGGEGSLLTLRSAFDPENQRSGPRITLGFAGNKKLFDLFNELSRKHDKDKTLKFPELLKLKLPKNTRMTRKQSRSEVSALRLPDGRWPDEVFPEFAPEYVHPRY